MGSDGPRTGRGNPRSDRPLIPIAPILAHYGVDLAEGRWGNELALCPVHGESRPSLSVSTEKGVAFCFACEFKGTALHLIMQIEGCDRDAALEKAEKILAAVGVEIKKRASSGRYQRPDAGRSSGSTSGRRYVPPGRR